MAQSFLFDIEKNKKANKNGKGKNLKARLIPFGRRTMSLFVSFSIPRNHHICL